MIIEEALELLKSHATPVGDVVTVPLSEVYGHILAEDIVADVNVPAFARSAMDGYAVKSEDVAGAAADKPVKLKVVSQILAGEEARISYTQDSAVRIMTGAMIPDGYDAVVKQEDTDYGEDEVNIYAPVGRYMNYCHVGEEIQKGETVLDAGRRVGMTETGLLASLGIGKVTVRRPLRVAIISTGSELATPGKERAPGCIYGNIRYMIAAAVKSEGFEVSYEADCRDELEEICSHIKKAVGVSDAVITTGGISVGKRDLVAAALSEVGAVEIFSHVDIQPGTPTMASVCNGKIILSLSGNPYAALANFDLYFPALSAKLTGCTGLESVTGDAVLCEPYEKVNRMRRLVRAREESGKVYLPAKRHMSSVFGNLDKCNCYIDVPAGAKLSVGDTVRIRRMRYR